MKKAGTLASVLWFCLALCFAEPQGTFKIKLKGVILDMNGLLEESARQSGVVIENRVRDPLGQKTIYDCETTLDEVLEACRGYYLQKLQVRVDITKDARRVLIAKAGDPAQDPGVIHDPQRAEEIRQIKSGESLARRSGKNQAVKKKVRPWTASFRKLGTGIKEFFKAPESPPNFSESKEIHDEPTSLLEYLQNRQAFKVEASPLPESRPEAAEPGKFTTPIKHHSLDPNHWSQEGDGESERALDLDPDADKLLRLSPVLNLKPVLKDTEKKRDAKMNPGGETSPKHP